MVHLFAVYWVRVKKQSPGIKEVDFLFCAERNAHRPPNIDMHPPDRPLDNFNSAVTLIILIICLTGKQWIGSGRLVNYGAEMGRDVIHGKRAVLSE